MSHIKVRFFPARQWLHQTPYPASQRVTIRFPQRANFGGKSEHRV